VDDRAKTAQDCWKKWISVMVHCWDQDPAKRPTFIDVHSTMLVMFEGQCDQLPNVRDVGFVVKRKMDAERETKGSRPSVNFL
jgi:hypothetical protein